jgi:hypothetical protein
VNGRYLIVDDICSLFFLSFALRNSMSTTICCNYSYLIFHFICDRFNGFEHLNLVFCIESITRFDLNCCSAKPYDFFQVFLEMLFKLLRIGLTDVLRRKANAQSLIVDIDISLTM